MRREFYYWINFFILFFFALFISTLQTVLFHLSIFSWMGLDLILLLISYLGIRRGLLEGVTLSILLARIVEIHSGAPAGFLMSCYLIVYATTVLTREFFLLESTSSILILALSSGALWKFVFLILSYKLDFFDNVWKPTLIFLVPFLTAQTLLIRPFFLCLQGIDFLTKIQEETRWNKGF